MRARTTHNRPNLTPAQAVKASERSEGWLRRHVCAWCGQTLWHALRWGCGAVGEQCDPAKKDFSRNVKARP